MAGARAVVIGGGFIGVEVASSLAARGMSVTVVERSPALWAGSLGERLSAWAVARLEGGGSDGAHCRRRSSSIGPMACRLAGETLAADLVVAGVGVEPRVQLAREAGLEVDDGVLVDEGQRTSAAGIFAAGDMARPRDGLRIEHWHAARESGRARGAGDAGPAAAAARAPWIFSEVAGVTLDVLGAATSVGRRRGPLPASIRARQRRARGAARHHRRGDEVEAARRLVEEGGIPQQLTSAIRGSPQSS